MTIIVQKYGGSSVADVDKIRKVADRVAATKAAGKDVDFRSDQFALGSIFYEMATGKRAFQRGTHAETLTAIG